MKHRQYLGKDFLADRGIAVDKWQTCNYYPETDSTMNTVWMFSDPAVTSMPGDDVTTGNTNGRLVATDGWGKTGMTNESFRYKWDITHNTFGAWTKEFEVPFDMYCLNAVTTRNLPKIPDHFRFKGEQVTTFLDDGSVALEYFEETYLKLLGLFVRDTESLPSRQDADSVSFYRQVTDFNMGLVYVMDRSTGLCDIRNISSSDISAYSIANGKVQMRTTNQFFDLDSSHYQYLGPHKHKPRGVGADVYTTVFVTGPRAGSVYTWYFASLGWLQSHGYMPPVPAIPSTLLIQQETKTFAMNIFEYSNLIDKAIPDVSSCYDVHQAIPVEVYFSGRYDQVVSPNPLTFQNNFLLKVMLTANIGSPLRVASIDVQPADNQEIVVRFLLLDRPNVSGDSANPGKEDSAKDVFTRLKQAVQSNSFELDIYRNTGSVKVSARGVGQFDRGGFHGVRVNAMSGDGYGVGAMAGIGVGGLVLGLLVGLIVVVAVAKCRRRDEVEARQNLYDESARY